MGAEIRHWAQKALKKEMVHEITSRCFGRFVGSAYGDGGLYERGATTTDTATSSPCC